MSSIEISKHQPKVDEQPPTTKNCLKAADATIINRFKKLVPEKARQVLGLSAQKAAITALGIYILISSGCGNVENPNVDLPNTPEPTTTPTRTPEPTPTATPRTIPTSTITPTNTSRPTPTRAPDVTPTSTPEVSVKGINFMFGEGVTPEQQKEIIDGITMAREWLSSKAGIKINGVFIFASANPTQLVYQYLQRTVYSRPRDEVQRQLAGKTAFVGEKNDMFINTSSPVWTYSLPIMGGPVAEGRKHNLAHEWFHIFQREARGYIGPFPYWLTEGSADYVAARTLADNNAYFYGKIRDWHLEEAESMRESLKSMESAQGFYGAGSPYADEYSLGFLAVEYLVKNLPNEGIPTMVRFWQDVGKGNPWQTAFQSSFGKTPDQFYSEFEKYRQQGFR